MLTRRWVNLGPAAADGVLAQEAKLRESAKTADLVLPAKQARSRLTRDRLLAAGRELLNQGAFEATSISDIARAAGCSVGAFYQRFADKEAFFTVIIETALEDIAAGAKRFTANKRLADASVERAIVETVRYWVNVFRRHRGLLRSMINKTLHAEDSWDPVREMGLVSVEPFIGMLAAKSGASNAGPFYYRGVAGFQIVFGVMLNASLHRTVLLNLDSDELVAWGTEILRHCLIGALPATVLRHNPLRAKSQAEIMIAGKPARPDFGALRHGGHCRKRVRESGKAE